MNVKKNERVKMKRHKNRPTEIDLKWKSQTVVRVSGVQMEKEKVVGHKRDRYDDLIEIVEKSKPRRILLLSCGHERTITPRNKLYKIGDKCACPECEHLQWRLDGEFTPPTVFFRTINELLLWEQFFPSGEFEERVDDWNGYAGRGETCGVFTVEEKRGRLVVWFE